MRITGGIARGIPLLVPPGDTVRPATDQLRQAVFSSLGARTEGARFLDLFAGTGAFGLEAVSRGAASGTFIEHHGRAISCLRRNLAAVCKSVGRTEAGLGALQRDATNFDFPPALAPDLVFIDPPYAEIIALAPALFTRLAAKLNRAADPLVIFEMPGDINLTPPGWTAVKRLGDGRRQPTVVIYRLAAPTA